MSVKEILRSNVIVRPRDFTILSTDALPDEIAYGTMPEGSTCKTDNGFEYERRDGVWKLVKRPINKNTVFTPQGTIPIDVNDGFWSTKAKEGIPAGVIISAKAYTAGSDGGTTYGPKLGKIFYPRYAIISADIDAQLSIGINPTPSSATICYNVAWCKAGTPLIIEFKGEAVGVGGSVVILANNPTLAGKLYGSIYGIEVTYDV